MKTAVIATTTWYKDLNEVRAKLALETIKEAARQGYRIVAVDGSPDSVKKSFCEAGATVLNEEKGSMGIGRRQAIKKATLIAGPDGTVIWMEPEKTPLVPFLDELTKYFFKKNIELLIPGRKTLSSYPLSQQHAEWLGNQTFQMLTEKKIDVWFGPRIFSTGMAEYFLNYQGEYGDKWDSIFIPILRAIKDGKKVQGVEIDYAHPKEQTGEEKENLSMHMKRIEQLTTLTKALCEESKILGLI